jgi:hypothetical protein
MDGPIELSGSFHALRDPIPFTEGSRLVHDCCFLNCINIRIMIDLI